MHRQVPVAVKKRGAFTREFSVAKVKALAKKLDATVNDCIMAIISNGCYQFFSRNRLGDSEIPTQIQFGLPISLREPPDDLREVDYSNRISTVVAQLGIFNNFDISIAYNKHYFTNLKNSCEPFATDMAAKMVGALPFNLTGFISNIISKKLTMVVTNLRVAKSNA